MKVCGEKIKALYSESGFSSAEMAASAGWKTSERFMQLTRGQGLNINPRIAEAIAKKLGVKVTDIQ